MSENRTPHVLFDELADAVGLPAAHFVELFEKQNDWTLVIQCHAIVETAVNSALLKVIQPPAAAEWATETRLTFRHRLDLCRRLELVDDTLFQAMGALAELRNSVVHSTDGLLFSCKKEIETGEPKRRERLYGILNRPNLPGIRLPEYVDPALLRFAIWGVAAKAVSRLVLNIKPRSFTVFAHPGDGPPSIG